MSAAAPTLEPFVGYSALHALARPGSAVSTELRPVMREAASLLAAAERSQSLFGDKAFAISEVWAVASECAEPDWNGEGAKAVDEAVAEVAADFIRALPNDVPLPEVAPDPDGSISLDWIRSRNRMFSLSVGASSRLAYAWLDGTDRGHAVARFDREKIPALVLDGINEVMNHGDAALRSR